MNLPKLNTAMVIFCSQSFILLIKGLSITKLTWFSPFELPISLRLILYDCFVNRKVANDFFSGNHKVFFFKKTSDPITLKNRILINMSCIFCILFTKVFNDLPESPDTEKSLISLKFIIQNFINRIKYLKLNPKQDILRTYIAHHMTH